MTTLFDALVATARALEALHEGTATGGSATTIADSALANLHADDAFNNGVAFIIQTTDGASPQGKSRSISDYAGTSGTATIPTVTDAVGAGDVYGLMMNRYPRGDLVGKINQALGALGDVLTVDVSLETVEDQREYALPAAAKRDLREVWVAGSTAAPWQWQPVRGTYVEGTAPGEAGTLLFPYQPRAGYKIKLVYLARHPYVQADTDVLADQVQLEWLGVEAARLAARQRLQGPGSAEKALPALVNDLDTRAEQLRPMRRSHNPQRAARLPFTREPWYTPEGWQ